MNIRDIQDEASMVFQSEIQQYIQNMLKNNYIWLNIMNMYDV